MTLIDRLGGRKFIMVAVTGFSLCVLVWFEKIADGVFESVMIATVGFYIAGNVVQKVKSDQSRSTDRATQAKVK